MVHQAGTGSWTRWYAYETATNRLTSTTGDPEHGPFRTYAHDAHGNMTSMPHIEELTWDENDQLRSTEFDGGGIVYYDYDAAGQRVRKVWEHSGLVDERIYLGGYEVYRRRNSSGLSLPLVARQGSKPLVVPLQPSAPAARGPVLLNPPEEQRRLKQDRKHRFRISSRRGSRESWLKQPRWARSRFVLGRPLSRQP
ncbi:hypothetical protein [Sorangium cellulosum]|uniref:Uncharacterized protein n=1 Tax=Sorangium cellulosum So0157-2 TaxID=1254432 RepID=S4Y9C9_SORCE|nr:hypothetical protein [Sorangium cellulosum]AGP39423.1 hypothetical protein SCE1572_36040 [Sorangium cellulosum So0157-2]